MYVTYKLLLYYFLLDAAMAVNAPKNAVKFVSLNGLTSVTGLIKSMIELLHAIILVKDLISLQPVIGAVKRKYSALTVEE